MRRIVGLLAAFAGVFLAASAAEAACSTTTLATGASANLAFGNTSSTPLVNLYDGSTCGTFNGDTGFNVHVAGGSLQNISGSISLPTGAATASNQTTGNSSLSTIATNTTPTPTGAAPPVNANYIGANASGATGGHLTGIISCDSHLTKHITTATDTLAVQGVASQTIYICGYVSRAQGVATWFLENTASANANCSSSNTELTALASETAGSGMVVMSAFWNGLKNTSGNGLCINSTGTGGVDVDIYYTQF